MADEIDFDPVVSAVRGALETLQPVHTLHSWLKTAEKHPGLVALGVGLAVAPHLAPHFAAGLEAAR